MFATTRSLRDRLDLRKVALVALIASGAFGLQLAFLAGTVASPLGAAIADLDRMPKVQNAPAQAFAEADPLPRPPADVHVARAPSARQAAVGTRHRAPSEDCVGYRAGRD